MRRDTDTQPNCERWMWIELIGFDNRRPDYNVQVFLDNCGFIPDGLSFLLTPPDFVHTHAGLGREVVFPPDYCSYGGKPYNAERERQAWTNHQFKGLVETLQAHGVKVYFSMFNSFVSHIDGKLYRSPWCDRNPALAEFTRDGVAAGCINPLKRFPDGRYYEDVFAEKLSAVMRDYAFDGYHAADGYSCPRQPIWIADYSDDMVAQFVDMMGVELPFKIEGGATSPAETKARADHIWNHHRHPWCEFYARRFESFFTKVCRAMHDLGRQVSYNNAWTRDPFEAYYRYGVDYRRIARAGVDRFFVETVGAGVSIGAESGFRADLRSELNFMLANIKACLPRMPLLCLNGTGDTTESWDLLNHAPAVSEREIYTLGHMFVQDEVGFHHASSGPFVCLADGINGPQWKWLRKNWVVGYECRPQRVLGATMLWSEAALDKEFDDYLPHRLLTRQKIAGELQERGAPLQVVVNSKHLAATRGCLLVPRPELLPASELQAVLDYAHGPVMLIGRQAVDLPPADLAFAEGPGPQQLACRVYHANVPLSQPTLTPVAQSDLPAAMPDPPNYLYGMYFRAVSKTFMQACADLLIEFTPTPRLLGEVTALRVLAIEAEGGAVRLLVGNEDYIYVLARLDMRQEVREVRIASHYPGRPIHPDGRFINVQVPPRGMIVLDVIAKGPRKNNLAV
ncbi:MAG: hypothetical protein A3K19_19910 [Lentisphaerae bacterium RIFOXYB12_FULL_65_16]|nr:MAG: hypothetical protein A3K18_07190 [Lentisphaerae bacterium RIFOXYA12_64_32]OGV85076.1 MAG: hypothetical protein A3K19_19910 [Lentisphaerae bacterium RIFOXYB12_FULL_65_16]